MSQSEKLMQVASKNELCDIRCFLEGQLPQTFDVYQSWVAGMLVPDDSWRFYVKRGSAGHYEAIVAAIKQKCLNPNSQTVENIWLISFWMRDETSLVQILEEIEEIDWLVSPWTIFGFNKVHLHSWDQKDSMKIVYDLTVSYALSISEALSLQIEVPGDVYVKSLERKHANIVYDTWAYNFSSLVEYVADEIDRFPSAGVFLKNGDVLVSWIMSYPSNGMSRLYTLEQYRRRGYAALAVRYMAKRSAQSGYLPFGNVLSTNEKSRGLFESLGFQLIRSKYIAYTKPH